MTADPEHPYVGRGGLKLRHALDVFDIDPTGLICADLGCSTGGFTDCLLQAGAGHVYAVDTGYGVLAWKLRNDPRVTVMERTNALHATPPEPVDLVTIDMGWTPQRLCIPAALKWLPGWPGPRWPGSPSRESDAPEAPSPLPARPHPTPRIITLIKPHYELSARDRSALPKGAVLDEAESERVLRQVLDEMPSLGVHVAATTKSPILGGKRAATGNVEYLTLLAPAEQVAPNGGEGA